MSRQCCHELTLGNITFFCVERAGHQCLHAYNVGIDEYKRLHERCEKAEADLTAARELLLRARRHVIRENDSDTDWPLHQAIDVFLAGKGE